MPAVVSDVETRHESFEYLVDSGAGKVCVEWASGAICRSVGGQCCARSSVARGVGLCRGGEGLEGLESVEGAVGCRM